MNKFIILSFSLLPLLTHCKTKQSSKKMQYKYTNALIHETSPYLLQHAHNPVNWVPWSKAAFVQAKKEHKLVLISIGYAACHWCHVMEHECFEDTDVAAIMNKNFICIKVDREARPDIDHLYMDAVQLMTGSGGWPLNCFALPDGRPVYGGTYFPKKQWMDLLEKLSEAYAKDPKQFEDYAQKLAQGIKSNSVIPMLTKVEFKQATLDSAYAKWSKSFDKTDGGEDYAPKFPMPVNYNFLLQYQQQTKDTSLLHFITLTLDKMAYGGIFDQIGGGFARYSTDKIWKVPHFEKMLYDNAQLISLYANAYKVTENPLYKEVVEKTIAFCERDLGAQEHLFYSSLDADSQGEEGKYYVWTKAEVKSLLPKHFSLIADYYNINETGHWEDDKYILFRTQSDSDFAKKHNLSLTQWTKIKNEADTKLLQARQKRVMPGLDNKVITSWNAMMVQAYTDAYQAFGDKKYLEKAQNTMRSLLDHTMKKDGSLFHTYTDKIAAVNGFLDDYAWCIQASISLYESTFKNKWLNTAKQLTAYVKKHFKDNENQMYYYSDDTDNMLISRKIEANDNVIPSSNSVMAKNLYKIGFLTDNDSDIENAKAMLKNVSPMITQYMPGYANWASLYLYLTNGFYEIAIVGKDCEQKRHEMQLNYIPNAVYCGSAAQSDISLLKDRYVAGKTLIYVCQNKTCKLPVERVTEAVKGVEN